VQRYKGLARMNAEELWQTTMNPETRTCCRWRLEDEEVAELIFTTLMGDASSRGGCSSKRTPQRPEPRHLRSEHAH